MALNYAPLYASDNKAAASMSAALTGVTGKYTYVSSFTITGGGATAGSVIVATLADGTNTLKFAVCVPAGAAVSVQPIVVNFVHPLQSATTGATWTLSVPSFGTGNTNAACTLTGYTQL